MRRSRRRRGKERARGPHLEKRGDRFGQAVGAG
jgi:hypothetical protein